MGNIVNDIVDEVDIKPSKSKRIIKIVIGIASSLVVVAFAFGQFKTSFFNRMDTMEAKLDGNTLAVTQLKTDMSKGFDATNAKIDKVYSDGLKIFNNFQEYNNKQLELIVDYGDGNKDMLKRMLEISSLKQQQAMEAQVEAAKVETKPPYKGEVEFIPIMDDEYINMTHFIEAETQDTIFNVTGATKKFINGIDRNIYNVGPALENKKYPELYDISYREKK